MIPPVPMPTVRAHQDTSTISLPPDAYDTFVEAAHVRIYHAQFSPKGNDWASSGLEGRLLFGRDNGDNSESWFRLIDMESDRIVWVFKLPTAGFVYEVDKPFFHVFVGKSRNFGFLFADDGDAAAFAKEVIDQTRVAAPKRSSARKNSLPVRLSPSLISKPALSTLVHVSHIGINKSGVVELSEGLDPIWRTVLPLPPNHTANHMAQDGLMENDSQIDNRACPPPRRTTSAWKVRRMGSAHQTV